MRENNMKQKDTTIGCLCAVGCEILYGMSYIFTKQATDEASAPYLLGWRFFLAFAVMSILLVFGVIKADFRGKSRKPLILISVFSPVIYFTGETFGIRNTTALESGVFLACIPVVSLIASAVILNKKPSKIQVTGISVTLAGVLLTVLSASTSSSFSAAGYAFLFIAVISYALYCVFVDKAFGYTGAEITYGMAFAGTAVFGIMALAEAAFYDDVLGLITLPFRNEGFLAAVLYQAVGCSVAAFFMSNVAISRIGVNRTSSFIGVSTVVSIISGALILGESFTMFQIAGALIIIAGVYTANSREIFNSIRN